MSIEEWEKANLDWAIMAHGLGMQAGDLGQFGDHPRVDNREPPD